MSADSFFPSSPVRFGPGDFADFARELVLRGPGARSGRCDSELPFDLEGPLPIIMRLVPPEDSASGAFVLHETLSRNLG